MYYNVICILYALLCRQNFILVKSGCYNLHPVHTKNDIDPLIFQDNKSGVKHLPSKLEWDFTGHLISNDLASGCADRIRHLGSTESNADLLSIGQAQEIMQSSRIKQNNDRVLVQKEHTDKNLLTKRNLLQRSEVGMANPRRQWVDCSLQLSDRWWWALGAKPYRGWGHSREKCPISPQLKHENPTPVDCGARGGAAIRG
jgi:hypothetical protein